MRIGIVHEAVLPAIKYGGTERVIWDLGEELIKMGHEVTYIVPEASQLSFGKKIALETVDFKTITTDDLDVLHFHSRFPGEENVNVPYVITLHGNINVKEPLNSNTIFVSENHAERFNSDSFVYNGLNWDNYSQPDLKNKREKFHFLGKGAWRIKNLKGAIDVVTSTKKEKMDVLGGVRFNINMGIRLTFSPRITFHGMVDNVKKSEVMNRSKGLIFPVLWHEPFGLAIIESLYFGCPVFGTPYGSLQELVIPEVGYLSDSRSNLSEAITRSDMFDKRICHQYARDNFNAKQMAFDYLAKYEKVLNGEKLNQNAPILQEYSEKFLNWIK